MECMMSVCKTIDWKIRDQALKISEKSTTWQGGRWGFLMNTPMCVFFFFFSNSADAVETSKKSESEEREKGSVLFSLYPLLGKTWQRARERKPEVYRAGGGTSSTTTDALILSTDTWSVGQQQQYD